MFASWEALTVAFIAEFSSIDTKHHLKQELELRTQYPEENLKEFIYTIAAYYDQIGGEVAQSEKLDHVLWGMPSQLQDLVESKQFANLAEIDKAADSLMEHAWRQLQYKPCFPVSCEGDWPAWNAAQSVDGCSCRAVSVSAGSILLAVAFHGNTAILPSRSAARTDCSCHKATSRSVVTGYQQCNSGEFTCHR